MKSKLESLPTFNDNETTRNCAWLLTTILATTLQFDNRRYPHTTLLEAYTKFFNCRQSPHQSVDEYRKTLVSWADIIDHYGGTLTFNVALTSLYDTEGVTCSLPTRRAAAKQETLAMALIRGADPARYGSLLLDLSNQFAAGRDQYPKDLLAAYALLIEYKAPYNARPRTDPPPPNPRPNPVRDSTATTSTAPSTLPPSTQGAPSVAPPATPSTSGHTFAQAVTGSTEPPATVIIQPATSCYFCSMGGHHGPTQPFT